MNKYSFVLRIFNTNRFKRQYILDILTSEHEFKTHPKIGRRYRIR